MLDLWYANAHDELSLDRLDDAVGKEVYAAFGPSKDMQVHGRGLRRRLGPMLDGESERLALAFSLRFALPGTPVLRYGDEIELGENLELDVRDSVRCPMQRTRGPCAGFSDADPSDFVRALAKGEGFGPDALDATDRWADPGSSLDTVRALATLRRAAREIGRGETRLPSPGENGDGPLVPEAARWRPHGAARVP